MKNCEVCGEAISAARLKAIPNADKCIACASKNDVPRTRRFDERVGEDTVENYYTGPDTPEIVRQKQRLDNLALGAWDAEQRADTAPVNPFITPEENAAVAFEADISEYAEPDEEGEEWLRE